MATITFITGNPDKLRELRDIFPRHLELTHKKLDIDEIQTLDLHEIISHKLRQAYSVIGKPVIVEDVSAGLESLDGLPGPFIKFFNQKLGGDALYKIGAPNDRAVITCTMGYYDGDQEIVVDGVVTGTVVSPRGSSGFGFDIVIQPDGYTQTFAEMDPAIKNEISHRGRAAQAMAEALSKRGLK